MTREEKYSLLYYCINTLWHEYIITSKQYDTFKAKIDKEYGKDDEEKIQEIADGEI